VLAKTNKAKKERKNREKQRNHQGEVVDKQTYKRKKIPCSGTIEFQS
jgi:hypothetical protein